MRLINNTITETVSTVRFQTSYEAFGIGIPFTTIATRTVTIPAFGRIIVEMPVMFFRSGHLCIGVAVDVAGYDTFYSSRNMDVMEDLRPGGGGDPAPTEIGPGQQINAVLAFRRFVAASGTRRAQGASAVGDTFGDVQRVDVAVKRSGKTNNGFSVQFQTVRIYLPLTRRS